jgi:MFS family permease
MNDKKLSITDFFAIITAISVTITAATQTYFYFRLDALWLMPLINPSIYLIEVIKVFLFLLCVLLITAVLGGMYAWLTKKIRHKKKIKISELDAKALTKLLDKNRKLYKRNFTRFYMGIFAILSFALIFIFKHSYLLITPLLSGGILGAALGCVLTIFLEKDLSRELKFVLLVACIIFISFFNAEMKYSLLKFAPNVHLLNDKHDFNGTKLIEISQGKVILLKRQQQSNEFTIVDTNEIKKISKQ